jgi:hypothetical protein
MKIFDSLSKDDQIKFLYKKVIFLEEEMKKVSKNATLGASAYFHNMPIC